MSAYAVVKDDTIINVVEWDGRSSFNPPGTLILLPIGAATGWVKQGGQWVNPHPNPPAPELPIVIDAWRFWAIVDREGLEEQIKGAIAAIPDATQRAVAKAKLDRIPQYHRDDPLFDQLGAQIGLSPQAIDGLFAAAAAL